MKLKTKLIPLASIVTACAAVTPLALTSCGKKNGVDLMEMYTPDFDKMEISSSTQPLSDEKAMEYGYDSVESDPERIAQENYGSEARNLQIINSRAFINDFDPDLMGSNIIYGGTGGTVPVAKVEFLPKDRIDQASYKEYVFSGISNRLRYTKYREGMHDISVDTQQFVYYDTETNARHELPIPTVSFTLEYDRTYESAYNGHVAKKAATDNKAAQVFYMQATRENVGTLTFDHVPVGIADLEDRSGVNCGTIVPLIQGGCENPDYDGPYAAFPYSFNYYLEQNCGISIDEEEYEDATMYPKAGSITSQYHNRQIGNYLSDTNGFDVNFEADTTEQLTLEDMPNDMQYIYSMSSYSYIVGGGIFASWYIHNAPIARKSMHLGTLDYFNGMWDPKP